MSIADLGQPAELTRIQKRRCDELAHFMDALGVGDLTIGELATTFKNAPEKLVLAARAIVVLGGFDSAVLSGEASLMLDSLLHDEDFPVMLFLWDGGVKSPLAAWDEVADPRKLQTELIGLFESYYWLGKIAREALITSPKSPQIIQGLVDIFDTLRMKGRILVGDTLLRLEPDATDRFLSWADSSDFVARAVAGVGLVNLASRSELAQKRIETLLLDEDAFVQETVINELDPANLTKAMARLVKQVADSKPGRWECENCGSANRAGGSSCKKCSVVGPRPHEAAAALLKKCEGYR
jgi:hypothetical protein